MGETVIVSLLFLLILGAVAFYFYSRMLYSERKINLLESILLDIKMNIEMEQEAKNDHMPSVPPQKMEQVEELKDDTEFYNAILESASEIPAAEEPVFNEVAPMANTEPVPPPVDYESMARDDLAVLAEKRGIRVTKRQSKTNIITLLREGDRNSSGASETGKDGPAGASNGFPSMEGTSNGAPLDMGVPEEVAL